LGLTKQLIFLKKLVNFYTSQNEPIRSCLLALKTIILAQDTAITNTWKYGMPFFCYEGKMFAYLWVSKKLGQPYIGFVEGKRLAYPFLIQEKRSRMKIMLIDANEDLPLETIEMLIKEALDLYRNGTIKVNSKA
jgi:Domain of unknown function (DU1801)